jgi:DNA-binding transcriptional LysR family regulator
MENLTALVIFARVVDAQGFSEAARRLGMSPSMVSKQVARLEKSLGARLLNRTTRKLAVTELGAMVYEHAARIVHEAEEIELAVQTQQSAPRGTLRLSAPAVFGMLHLTPLVSRFLARHPDVRVDMTLSDRIIPDLVEDRLDAAFVIATRPTDNFVARRMAPIRWILCAAPAYLARHGAPASVADIAHHNCLVFPELVSAGAWRFRVGSHEETAEVAGNFSTNSAMALRTAALDGLGLAVLPTFLVGPDLKEGRLKLLLPGCRPFLDSALQAIYLPGRPLPAKVTAFLDLCQEEFGPTPWWEQGLDLPAD